MAPTNSWEARIGQSWPLLSNFLDISGPIVDSKMNRFGCDFPMKIRCIRFFMLTCVVLTWRSSSTSTIFNIYRYFRQSAFQSLIHFNIKINERESKSETKMTHADCYIYYQVQKRRYRRKTVKLSSNSTEWSYQKSLWEFFLVRNLIEIQTTKTKYSNNNGFIFYNTLNSNFVPLFMSHIHVCVSQVYWMML